MLAKRAEDYRVEYNQIRPHEAIAWNRPTEVHLGLADPTIANFEQDPCRVAARGAPPHPGHPRRKLSCQSQAVFVLV